MTETDNSRVSAQTQFVYLSQICQSLSCETKHKPQLKVFKLEQNIYKAKQTHDEKLLDKGIDLLIKIIVTKINYRKCNITASPTDTQLKKHNYVSDTLSNMFKHTAAKKKCNTSIFYIMYLIVTRHLLKMINKHSYTNVNFDSINTVTFYLHFQI